MTKKDLDIIEKMMIKKMRIKKPQVKGYLQKQTQKIVTNLKELGDLMLALTHWSQTRNTFHTNLLRMTVTQSPKVVQTLTRPTRPAQTKVGLMLWEIPIFRINRKSRMRMIVIRDHKEIEILTLLSRI